MPETEDGKIDMPKLIALNERVQKGLELYGKHYMSLWD